MNDWDIYFMGMAKRASSKSKDPSTKVGAVIVRPDNSLVSTGFNGFPTRIEDRPEWYADRNRKMALTIHGEINAVRYAREPVDGYTLYTWPFLCCSKCALQMVQWGIAKIVTVGPPPERWVDDMRLSEEIFALADVEVVVYDQQEMVAAIKASEA